MIQGRFVALAATVAVALAAKSSRAQDFPGRAVGGTVAVGLSGFSATIFGEGDRGY
jgi:hypothetical protein